jgi:hypothetical protein
MVLMTWFCGEAAQQTFGFLREHLLFTCVRWLQYMTLLFNNGSHSGKLTVWWSSRWASNLSLPEPI